MKSIAQKRPRRHLKLRALLQENNLTQVDLQMFLGRSESYITARMTGKRSWELDDCYKMLGTMGVPADEISDYFPRGGKS